MKLVLSSKHCLHGDNGHGFMTFLVRGTTVYLNEWGEFHSINGPAIISPNGDEEKWYFQGHPHRDGGPAHTRKDGYEAWYCFGRLHREDGPAVTFPGGKREWYHKRWQCALIVEDSIRYQDQDEELQEFFIRNRPDLIWQITCLLPSMREKYCHELNLSGIEI
jgi:hypothetical protein